MKKFTETHEWIEVNEGIGTVGVTQFAQKELGDIVFVELPILGKKVHGGQEACVLESTKAAADVYAPVSGEIIEVNQALKEAPEKVNNSPEAEGWLFKLKIENISDLDKLLNQP